MFHILANLDQEERWLGTTLPEHIQRRLAAMAMLLQALAPEGEPVTIHTSAVPQDIKPTGLFAPSFDTKPPPRVDLAWCDPAARPFNDRRLSFAIARELGCALPRAAVLSTLAAIDEHLSRADGPWVLKAPWSSAGRHRVFGTGPLEGELRVATERLLALTGELTYEPWCERICDVAVCGVAGGEVREPHRILNGPRGNFLGIELRPNVLEVGEHDQLVTIAERVAQRLFDDGYRGPFGIDAFVYSAGGERRLHPLCEINARHTFGHVAHALGQRFGAKGLRFGGIAVPRSARTLVDTRGIMAWIV